MHQFDLTADRSGQCISCLSAGTEHGSSGGGHKPSLTASTNHTQLGRAESVHSHQEQRGTGACAQSGRGGGCRHILSL